VIFLKTRKTAGTSIEVAFSANAGPGDILTPLAGKAETMRLAPPFRPAQNWSSDPSVEAEYVAHVHEGRGRGPHRVAMRQAMETRMEDVRRFSNHMSAKRLRQTLGRSFDRALKVTAVRHPYEVVVSFAWMSFDGRITFREQVDQVLRDPKLQNWAIYAIKQRPVAAHVLRHEQLEADLQALENKTGLSLVAHLPQTKHLARKDKRPARDQLTPAQRLRVFDLFEPEFMTFGYRP